VINEKKLVEQSGLQDVHRRFSDTPATPPELLTWLDELRAVLKQARPCGAKYLRANFGAEKPVKTATYAPAGRRRNTRCRLPGMNRRT